MQSLIARKALHKSVRGFASSATRAQAVPLEKPVLVKEFKIYRWVRPLLSYTSSAGKLMRGAKNPDEPSKKPELQSYKIDINQCGPMVRRPPPSLPLHGGTCSRRRPPRRSSTRSSRSKTRSTARSPSAARAARASAARAR